MPAAAVLTKAIKQEIARIYLADKTAPAKEVRDKVHEFLGRADWPKLSVIQRELKRIRDKDKASESEGKHWELLWHLGLMREYSISPEAAIYILAVQTWAEHNQHEPVTIGQAQWIARLYSCISDVRDKRNIKDRDKDLNWLWHWSRAYAIEERVSELAPPFDTSRLDKALREFAAAEVFPDWAYVIFTRDGKLIDGGPGTIHKNNQSEVKNERTHNTTK